MIALRREHPNLRRRKFFQDRSIRREFAIGAGGEPTYKDIMWIRPDGEEMTDEEWGAGWVRCIGLQLSGKALDHVDALGQPLQDETYLILLNPHWEPIQFYLPKGSCVVQPTERIRITAVPAFGQCAVQRRHVPGRDRLAVRAGQPEVRGAQQLDTWNACKA